MRNSLLMIPGGILLIVALAFVSVQFGVMSMAEFTAKMKILLLLLAPAVGIVGLFAFLEARKRRQDEQHAPPNIH